MYAIPAVNAVIPKNGDEVITAHRIVEVLSRVLQPFLYTEIPAEDLLARDITPAEKRGYPAIERAVYELRHLKGPRIPESAVNGRMGTREFGHFIAHAIMDEIDGVKKSQPNGDWRLVAARITRRTQREFEKRENAGNVINASEGYVGEVKQDDRGISPAERRSTLYRVLEADHARWHVELVVADISQSELLDGAIAYGNVGVKSWYSGYIESGRQLGKMSANAKVKRQMAEAVLRHFAGVQQPELEETGTVTPPAPRLTNEQLDAARDALAIGATPATVASILGVPVEVLDELVFGPELPDGAPAPAPKKPGKRG